MSWICQHESDMKAEFHLGCAGPVSQGTDAEQKVNEIPWKYFPSTLEIIDCTALDIEK